MAFGKSFLTPGDVHQIGPLLGPPKQMHSKIPRARAWRSRVLDVIYSIGIFAPGIRCGVPPRTKSKNHTTIARRQLNNPATGAPALAVRCGTPCFLQRGIPSLPPPHHSPQNPSFSIGYSLASLRTSKSTEPAPTRLISAASPRYCPVLR